MIVPVTTYVDVGAFRYIGARLTDNGLEISCVGFGLHFMIYIPNGTVYRAV